MIWRFSKVGFAIAGRPSGDGSPAVFTVARSTVSAEWTPIRQTPRGRMIVLARMSARPTRGTSRDASVYASVTRPAGRVRWPEKQNSLRLTRTWLASGKRRRTAGTVSSRCRHEELVDVDVREPLGRAAEEPQRVVVGVALEPAHREAHERHEAAVDVALGRTSSMPSVLPLSYRKKCCTPTAMWWQSHSSMYVGLVLQDRDDRELEPGRVDERGPLGSACLVAPRPRAAPGGPATTPGERSSLPARSRVRGPAVSHTR